MIDKGRLLPENVDKDLLALSKVHITQNTYMILTILSHKHPGCSRVGEHTRELDSNISVLNSL